MRLYLSGQSAWFRPKLSGVRISQGALFTGLSSAWLEYVPWTHGVVGSNPAVQTKYACMIGMADMTVSKAVAARREGSSPSTCTKYTELSVG